MRNFHAWQRRTMRRADKQIWCGVLLIVTTTAAWFWLIAYVQPEAPLWSTVVSIVRCLTLLPALAGVALAVVGASTAWRLQRDPVMLYYRRDGR